MGIERKFKKMIIEIAEKKLERSLTKEENNILNLPRSFIAYEMIKDYLSSPEISKNEIQN
ncbi:MAG: hypothetical protein IPM32_14380 [Ignavibacteriae bacterium]|nr:hypothetical protein [Ignavibacteriota bacterium]